jgi:integrase
VTAREAARVRANLFDEVQVPARNDGVRVTDFARSWIESKAAIVSGVTADRYTEALENHILPAFGDRYCDSLRPLDVQRWVNEQLRGKEYRVATVRGWFSVFRTMMADAAYQLDLPRDPTKRISFPETEEPEGENALRPEQLQALLDAFKEKAPQHYGLVAVQAFTGLRFAHASALKWEDVDYEAGVIHVRRRQVRGDVGPVSRRKRAPRRYPLAPELAEILRWHRRQLLETQAPGFEEGWMFPSSSGTLRASSSVQKAWKVCCEAAGITGRFTPHGLRRTFNDLARRAGVDAVVTKSLTGHVTERMREHYSTVGLDEKRAAIAGVVRLIKGPVNGAEVGTDVGTDVGTGPKVKNAGL